MNEKDLILRGNIDGDSRYNYLSPTVTSARLNKTFFVNIEGFNFGLQTSDIQLVTVEGNPNLIAPKEIVCLIDPTIDSQKNGKIIVQLKNGLTSSSKMCPFNINLPYVFKKNNRAINKNYKLVQDINDEDSDLLGFGNAGSSSAKKKSYLKDIKITNFEPKIISMLGPSKVCVTLSKEIEANQITSVKVAEFNCIDIHNPKDNKQSLTQFCCFTQGTTKKIENNSGKLCIFFNELKTCANEDIYLKSFQKDCYMDIENIPKSEKRKQRFNILRNNLMKSYTF